MDGVIRVASEHGNFNLVKLLLEDSRVNPSAISNESIRLASENGHFNIIQLLLADKRVDPSDEHNTAVVEAMKNCHIDVVNLLLTNYMVCKYLHPKWIERNLNDEQIKIYEKNLKIH